jgi:hypothetical protein
LGFQPTIRDSDYPALFTSADATAKAAQHRHTQLVEINLILIVAAALFGLLEPVNQSLAVFAAIASAVMLGAALAVELGTRLLRLERRWYEDRSVAEAVKSASWRYMMKTTPFDGDDADREFAATLAAAAQARRNTADVPPSGSGPGQEIGDTMRRVRSVDFESRKEVYLRQRVVDQINYYRFKAAKNTRSATTWFWIGVIARGAAFMFAIAVAVAAAASAAGFPTEGARLVELLAAVAAAGTAWAELGRHEEQAKSYGGAAQELTAMRPSIEDARDEATLRRVVVDAESVMSREQSLWTVKRV